MGRNNRQVQPAHGSEPVGVQELNNYKIVSILLLQDCCTRIGAVCDDADISTIQQRCLQEGIAFLTKRLPELGKALDQCLLNGEFQVPQGWRHAPDKGYPLFLRGLWETILTSLGRLKDDPDTAVIRAIRDFTYAFYKLRVPYDSDTVRSALDSFESTDRGLATSQESLGMVQGVARDRVRQITQGAYLVLSSFLRDYRPYDDFMPKHGPGVVAQREKYESKFMWTNIPTRLTDAFDASFFLPLSTVNSWKVKEDERCARIILVPKDSRGPRIISAEPVEYQWIQQGIMRSIIRYVESGATTGVNPRGFVNFTDQEVNGRLALLSSKDGSMATLDLKEASDRISLALVRAIFPEDLHPLLECCRSQETMLPDGRRMRLRKYAPMGSGLCFPVLALSIWALLRGQGITSYVYGDDVIVPRSCVENTIATLESVGLLVNRSKSCFLGYFRESCGVDAYKGVDVTPVRITKRWSSHPSSETLMGWLSLANSYYRRGYYRLSSAIRKWLIAAYGYIPSVPLGTDCGYPAFEFDDGECDDMRRRRWNSNLQRFEYLTLVTVPEVHYSRNEYANYLRALTKSTDSCVESEDSEFQVRRRATSKDVRFRITEPMRAHLYTIRRANKLARRWV